MHRKQTLVSLGCSWTAGVGAHYLPNDAESDYKKNAWDQMVTDQYSFKNILAQKFNLSNFNISKGGASNDYNFEELGMIFGDPKKKQQFLDSEPIVLWGITSTARIYRNKKSIFLRYNRETSILLFLEKPYIDAPSTEDLKFILQDQETLYSSLYLKLFYNHDDEVTRLANLIEIWNDVFAYHNIPVIWFDTFNTHDYYNSPRNFFQGGDILSQMLTYKKINYKSDKKWYHLSDWTDDDNRITVGVCNQLLNPFSFHPGQEGHKVIAEILSPSIQQYIK
jgi:hypothetical protein